MDLSFEHHSRRRQHRPSSELDGADLITINGSASAVKVIANGGADSLVLTGQFSIPPCMAAAVLIQS